MVLRKEHLEAKRGQNLGRTDGGTPGDAAIGVLGRRVEVQPTGGPGTLATARLKLADGHGFDASVDVGIPAADLEAQGERLRAKFESLAVPLLGGKVSAALMADLEALQDLADASQLTRHLSNWTA